jgi:hypothetical protein
MKTIRAFLCARPWLLVVLAFVILISAWSALIVLSRRVPSARLDPGEEAALLERKR